MRSPQLGRPSSARLNRREAAASLLQATLQQVAHEQRIVAEAAAEAAAVEASQRRRVVHLPLEATNSRVVSAEDRRTAVGLPLSTPEDQLIVAEAAWKRRQAVRLPLEATDVQVTEAEERAAMKAEAEAAAREARDARATRQKELQRRIQLLEAAGFPSALGTLDRASVTTPLGQACCRLALACSLWPRLCSDSANDDLVPEPELLERIGLHLFEQAELKAAQRQIEITEIEITKIETEMAETEIKIPKQYEEIREIKKRAEGILDTVMPELHAAFEALRSLKMNSIPEIRSLKMMPAQCVPVCEAICALCGIKPQKTVDL